MTVRHDGFDLTWFGNAAVRIESPDGFVTYLDPGRCPALDRDEDGDDEFGDADLICVTHAHHYDDDAIRRVARDDAALVVYGGLRAEDTAQEVRPVEDLPYETVTVGREDHATVGPADVWSMPAYNREDGPHTRDDGTPYHPEGLGVGYLVSIDGTAVFYPGDSDALDGHRELEPAVFLAPIGGAYAMDADAAAELATALDPDLVVPVHYAADGAMAADPEAFAADVAGRSVPVAIDQPDAR